MPKSKEQIKINLIPQDEFESSTFGRVLKWALSTFRIMVIVTELLVMSAFLSRFWLDARNSDLNEEIEIKKAQIGAYQDVEDSFRKYQAKLVLAKSLYSTGATSQVFKTLSSLMPVDIAFNSIVLKEGLLTIKASSLAENSIAQFLINMENSNNFNETKLSQVTRLSENNSVSFVITTKIVEGRTK